ncbi:putative defective protein IntQ [Clostridiales bacterium]|nr:putative defective protein IntQ [Clostridiales bacterium]
MSRSAQGSGTIRQRKDGRWEGRITVGRNPATGRQIQKSIYGKTQAEVSKKMRQLCKEVDDGIYKEPVKYTVKDWAKIWLNEYTASLKPLTVKQYTSYTNNHIIKNIGSVKLTRLDAPIIQRFYNQMSKDGLTPKTIKNVHGILHLMLETAAEVGYINSNPSSVCKLPKIEKKQIKPLENEDLIKFLNAIHGNKHETLYLVDLFTGLRQSELLGLTWDCINFDKGTMYVYRQLQKNNGVYYFASLKNGKSRTIALAPSIVKALRAQRAWQAECKLKSYGMWDNKDDLVFTNELGGHLTQTTIYQNFKRIVGKIGVPGARFHDLRHTYAVVALQSGDDIKTVQEALGHHTAAFTLDVYGHVTEQMRNASAARLENFINSVNPV